MVTQKQSYSFVPDGSAKVATAEATKIKVSIFHSIKYTIVVKPNFVRVFPIYKLYSE
jgi:hypothetical protein